MILPDAFLNRPITHRALHDVSAGRAENSAKAIQAAIDAGYGIEIDLQLSRDGQAMVFHDYDLARLTGTPGPIAMQTAEALRATPLLHDGDGIPTLTEVLAQVAGRVPLMIELKDQDGMLGPNIGTLEKAVADALIGYVGPAAFMSFNPHSVAEMAVLAPDIPRGHTTTDFPEEDWPTIPATTRAHLRTIPDFTRTGACFISHKAANLHSDIVKSYRDQGIPVLCWTIHSAAQEAQARKFADNITFEGYLA